MDDISQGIGSVDISNNSGISAAVAVCDMNSGREEDMNSEKKCTSYDQKLEQTKTNDVEVDVSTTDMAVSICANCGKEGASNTCNKCKQVKYCNAACKKRHRHKHKKDCEEHLKRLTELQEEECRRAAELHDEQLYKQPPTIDDDCPICFQRLPFLETGKRYQSCCGKIICSGCIHAVNMTRKTAIPLCPFCRVPTPTTDEEIIQKLMKRAEDGDAEAVYNLGSHYTEGAYGLPQDHTKGLELFHRAAELGDAISYHNIGNAYHNGRGVEMDRNKSIYYYEQAAMRGYATARHNLGAMEALAGNMDRAIKHYLIAVRSGEHDTLKQIQNLYSYVKGHVTKDDYTKALRSYQKYLVEIRSPQRDEAAAAREDYKYID